MAVGLRCAWAAAVALAVASASTGAATLVVTAVVLPKASVTLAAAPAVLDITADDVRRGYVDAHAPLPLAMRSTSNRGMRLFIGLRSAHIRQARVEGLGAPMHLPAAGGFALLPAARERAVALQFRFYLDPATPPGTYPWPVQLEASA